MNKDILTVGTTFSGIGAPETALKTLGIPHIVKYACDIDKHAKTTYLANHSCEAWYDDITKIDVGNLPYVDLFVGGFPCQSYSSCGQRLGIEDHRGKLVYYLLKILKTKQPKYFLAENVKGLLESDKGNTFRIIKEAFEDCGYRVYWKLLNSKTFGVAQSRPRVYIVGIRKDIDKVFNFDVLPKHPAVSIWDIVEENPVPEHPIYKFKRHITTNRVLDVNKNYTGSIATWPRTKEPGVVRAQRLHAREDTVVNCLTRIPSDSIIYYRGVLRPYTENEMKRLQGFPDNFVMPVKFGEIQKQMGNTMTVNVVKDVLAQLLT